MLKISRLAILGAGAALLVGTPASVPARADDLSEVEGARASERAGRYLTERDVELLDRHGGNDDHPRYYYYDDDVAYGPAGPYGPPAGYVEYGIEYDD